MFSNEASGTLRSLLKETSPCLTIKLPDISTLLWKDASVTICNASLSSEPMLSNEASGTLRSLLKETSPCVTFKLLDISTFF